MDKEQIRRRHRRQRLPGTPSDEGEALAQALRKLLAAHGVRPGATVAAFIPAAGEPDVVACMAQARARGDRVVVPRTLPERGLEWIEWSPTVALVPDRHGLQAPHGTAEDGVLADPVVVMLIPALAADRHGARLGHGAGYYDRALAGLPRWPAGPLRVAVVHRHEVTPGPLPTDAHDEPVDAVLTADGWFPVQDD